MRRLLLLIALAGAGSVAPAARAADDWLGVVFTRESVELVAESDGEVRDVPVRLGARVAAGDVLLRLDAPDLRARLAQERASLGAAEGRVEQARADLADADRRAVRREGATDMYSDEEIATARSAREGAAGALAAAEAQVEERRAALAELQREVSRLEMRAPFAGTVAACWFEAGQRVRAGEAVARVVGDDRPWIRFAIPSRAAGGLSDGDAVEVREEATGAVWAAQVRHVAPDVDASLDLVFAEAELAAPEAAAPRIGEVVRVRPVGAP
ncbi:MAG: efflux RND transporter periplasmic adaptor subunit [bacterium]